jgi:hypothetical protein
MEINISTDIRRGLAFKLLTIVSIVFLLPMILYLLIEAYRPMTPSETLVFLVLVGSFGGSLGFAVIYGGLVKQHLTLDGKGITYVHRPSRKHIPWSELERVKLLGVNDSETIRCGILFSSKDVEIGVGSDFEKGDMQKVSKEIEAQQKEHDFEINDKE